MLGKSLHVFFLMIGLMWLGACRGTDQGQEAGLVSDTTRIVSINGAVTEIIVALGLEDHIVGTDISSNYPLSMLEKPKVGHNRRISAEGVLALGPDLVMGTKEEMTPQLEEQLKAAGAKLILFEHEYSVEGVKTLISAVADSLGFVQRGDSILQALNSELAAAAAIETKEPKPKVLFIYARGTGTMMVGGEGTQAEEIIELAGGENAVEGFEDFKPLTPEALVAANPDVLLLFSSGLESLGGVQGLENVQGVHETNAGKNKRFVAMDGQLLTGFGPRLGLAVKELKEKIHE